MSDKLLVSIERIEKLILIIRGQKVIVDADLAHLYEVETKVFNQAVKRNIKRFPSDFMFKLNKDEKSELVTSCDRFARLKHSTVAPNVFTEQGVAMLSTVLNSERAIEVNIQIMRVFVQMRKLIASNAQLAQRLDELERKTDRQDDKIKAVFEAIKQLMEPTKKKRNPIGFKPKNN